MKTATTAFLLFVTFSITVHAIDLFERAPGDSVAATIFHATGISHELDLKDAGLDEVLKILPIPPWLTTPEDRIQIDASQIKDRENVRINLVSGGMTILEALSKIADQIGAKLVIERGKISLVPDKQKRGEPR